MEQDYQNQLDEHKRILEKNQIEMRQTWLENERKLAEEEDVKSTATGINKMSKRRMLKV